MNAPESTDEQHPVSDVRLRIFEAAWDLTSETGIEDGTSTLSLDDVVGRAGVPRSTAYRHFTVEERTPRAEFRRCFAEWVRHELQDQGERDANTAEMADEFLSMPIPESADERRQLLAQLLAETMAADQMAVERNGRIAASIALRAALWSRMIATDDVDDWAPKPGPDTKHWESITQSYLDRFGARLRPGMTIELLLEFVGAWSTGIVLTMGLDRTVAIQPRSADSPIDIGLSGIGYLALIDTFVDFDESIDDS